VSVAVWIGKNVIIEGNSVAMCQDS